MAQITISDDLITLFKCEYARRMFRDFQAKGPFSLDDCELDLDDVQVHIEAMLREWIDREHDIPLTFMEGDSASIAEWVALCRAKAAASGEQKAVLP